MNERIRKFMMAHFVPQTMYEGRRRRFVKTKETHKKTIQIKADYSVFTLPSGAVVGLVPNSRALDLSRFGAQTMARFLACMLVT